MEQKIHATAKTANANVHVAKVENVHAKGNAHAAAIVNKKKKKLTTNTLRDTNY